MSKVCAGCLQKIPDKRFMQCSICQQNYDLECSNISELRFYNIMKEENKKAWKCPQCIAQKPKLNIDNSNTPIRKQTCTLNSDISITPVNTSADTSNVTLRKKATLSDTINNSDDDDFLPEGNTLKTRNSSIENLNDSNTINIQQFDELLKRNLKENNENILRQVKM